MAIIVQISLSQVIMLQKVNFLLRKDFLKVIDLMFQLKE